MKYRVPSIVIQVIGVGMETVKIVERALKESDKADKNKNSYDQIWCVFDRDSFPPDQFNKALELARNNDIKVAYSNEAFELWYLLHFQYLDSAITRQDYIEKLIKHLGGYTKNSENMYDTLLPDRDTAIQNAKTLLSNYNPLRPANDNPSTTIHLLVEELLKNSP